MGLPAELIRQLLKKIAEKLGVSSTDVHDIAKFNADEFKSYDVLLLGSSTWGDGDLQDDWYDPIESIKNMDLHGKKIALFSNGDSASYPDTFVGAMRHIYDAVKNTGAEIAEGVSTDGYDFSGSEAVIDGKFIGLAIDEDNESDKTDERIDSWIHIINA